MFLVKALLQLVGILAFGLISSWALASDMPCHKSSAPSVALTNNDTTISASNLSQSGQPGLITPQKSANDFMQAPTCCQGNCECPIGSCAATAAIHSNLYNLSHRKPVSFFKEQLRIVLSISLPRLIRPPIFA